MFQSDGPWKCVMATDTRNMQISLKCKLSKSWFHQHLQKKKKKNAHSKSGGWGRGGGGGEEDRELSIWGWRHITFN